MKNCNIKIYYPVCKFNNYSNEVLSRFDVLFFFASLFLGVRNEFYNCPRAIQRLFGWRPANTGRPASFNCDGGVGIFVVETDIFACAFYGQDYIIYLKTYLITLIVVILCVVFVW